MQSKRNLPLALLLVAIFLLYSNSLSNAFHFDDFHTVTDNPAVRSLHNLPRILTDTTAFSVLPANQTYRPVVTASLAFDYALARGYSPFWFHLSTLLWYLVLVSLLYSWAGWIFDQIDPRPENHWFALGLAAWFGVHPAMAETVNYVIQRGDLYCTLGCIAGLLIYFRYPFQRRFGLYLLPFVVAMLSKPPASVFPLLLFFAVFFFEVPHGSAQDRLKRALVACLPAAAVAGALLWLQAAMTPKTYAPTILSAAAYRLTQPFVWLRYFAALFLPLHLNVDTDLQPFAAMNARALAGLGFAVVLLALAVLCARQRVLRPVAYGLVWFLLTQMPTSLYALSEVENDHRMFFSFPGLMLAVVWLLRLGYGRLLARAEASVVRAGWLPRVAAAAASFVLCGYAYGAHRRNIVWHSEASLWADDVAKSPRNGRGLMIYGLTRMNVGDYPAALTLFTRALEYTPNYPTLEINLGIVNGLLADAGQPARRATAEQHFQRAILLAPGDDLTHVYFGRWLLGHGRLGEAVPQLETAVALNGQREMQRDLLLDAYQQTGNNAAARALAESTLAQMPGDRSALTVLHGGGPRNGSPQVTSLINASLSAYQAKQYGDAVAKAQEALRLDPGSAEAWNNLGAGYGALQQWEEGIAAERRALQLNPSLTIAANNLRWFESQKGAPGQASSPETRAIQYINESLVLNQAGRYADSIAAAQKALALNPQAAEAWNNIAADDEALRRWDEAIEAAQHALAIRPDFQLARNNLAWSQQQRAAAGKQPVR